MLSQAHFKASMGAECCAWNITSWLQVQLLFKRPIWLIVTPEVERG